METDRWEKEQHSPTVMDSGRPDVGSTLESGAGWVGGLDSILQHVEKGTRYFDSLCHRFCLLLWHLFPGLQITPMTTHHSHVKLTWTLALICRSHSFPPALLTHTGQETQLCPPQSSLKQNGSESEGRQSDRQRKSPDFIWLDDWTPHTVVVNCKQWQNRSRKWEISGAVWLKILNWLDMRKCFFFFLLRSSL